MSPIYAIGDVHGQKDMLDRALALIEADGGPDAQIVFLGDYTDRGPDSRGVIQTLIDGQLAARNWTCLVGNHDRMFTGFVRNGAENSAQVKSGINWLNPRLGGSATLASYGVRGGAGPSFFHPEGGGVETLVSYGIDTGDLTKAELVAAAQASVPQSHLDFLDGLPLWHMTDDLLFVHAGLRPGVALQNQAEDDLIWIRDGFLNSDYDFGHLVVHGHTALDAPQHFGNRIDLDGGAGYGRPLIPAVFEGRDCWLLTDNGRVRLTP